MISRVCVAIISAALALSSGCGGAPTQAQDLDLCYQTYEFGNFGCGEVHGRIVDAQGQPIFGAFATVTSTSGGAGSVPFAATGQADSFGKYQLRVIYYQQVVAPQNTQAWLRFAMPYCPALIVRDSVLVTVPKANVGEHAPVLEVPDATLTLPTSAQRVAACG